MRENTSSFFHTSQTFIALTHFAEGNSDIWQLDKLRLNSSAFLLCKTIDFTDYLGTFQDTAVADKHDSCHLFVLFEMQIWQQDCRFFRIIPTLPRNNKSYLPAARAISFCRQFIKLRHS